MKENSHYLVKVVISGVILKFATEKEPDIENWDSTQVMLETAGLVRASGCEETIVHMSEDQVTCITWTFME
jgi:hypothetical protein